MRRHYITVILTLGLFALDQVTKYFFVDQELGGSLFIPVFNTGAAWSIPIPTTIITITAIAMSIWTLRTYHKNQISTLIAALFLGGIRGNMIDRIFYPGVRDFIFIGDRFPIFNIADIWLTIGVILIIRHEYRGKTNKQ